MEYIKDFSKIKIGDIAQNRQASYTIGEILHMEVYPDAVYLTFVAEETGKSVYIKSDIDKVKFFRKG